MWLFVGIGGDTRMRRYVKIDYGVLHDRKILDKAYEKMVYVMLCKHANYETKESFPSISLLASECGCSESSVRRAVRRLQSLGLISIRSYFNNQGRRINVYTILDIPESFPKEMVNA